MLGQHRHMACPQPSDILDPGGNQSFSPLFVLKRKSVDLGIFPTNISLNSLSLGFISVSDPSLPFLTSGGSGAQGQGDLLSGYMAWVGGCWEPGPPGLSPATPSERASPIPVDEDVSTTL